MHSLTVHPALPLAPHPGPDASLRNGCSLACGPSAEAAPSGYPRRGRMHSLTVHPALPLTQQERT